MIKIIAECGCNFKDIEEAKLMIRRSKEIGCWAAKFQLFSENEIKGSPYYDFLKSIVLNYEKASELFQYGKSIGQEIFFTPMYSEAIDICERIGVNYYKIRYADQYNVKIFNAIIETKKPFFISTHIPFKEKNAINFICIPEYPAKLVSYLNILNSNIYFNGISDHLKCACLLEYVIENKLFKNGYFEKHVKLDNDCLESKWSVLFDDLEKIIKEMM